MDYMKHESITNDGVTYSAYSDRGREVRRHMRLSWKRSFITLWYAMLDVAPVLITANAIVV